MSQWINTESGLECSVCHRRPGIGEQYCHCWETEKAIKDSVRFYKCILCGVKHYNGGFLFNRHFDMNFPKEN